MLFLALVGACGCSSMGFSKQCEPIIKLQPEPYPVLVELPCAQVDIPPEITLFTTKLEDNVTWSEAIDALIQDVQQLKRENEALRKELEAYSVPVEPIP